MIATFWDEMAILGLTALVPVGWLFADIIPGYWLIYFGLVAWYVVVSIQRYRRHKKRARNFYHYKIEKETEDDAA